MKERHTDQEETENSPDLKFMKRMQRGPLAPLKAQKESNEEEEHLMRSRSNNQPQTQQINASPYTPNNPLMSSLQLPTPNSQPNSRGLSPQSANIRLALAAQVSEDRRTM